MVTTVTDNSPQSINTSLFSLDKDIQEIKKVTDKLTGINTEANVISVNGKQGIVELNAGDVNALPDTTVIPTTTSELENTSGFITSSDSITGNAATATKAKQDANGNVITDTYATKELIATETSERKTADEGLQTQITANKNAIDTLNGTGIGSVKKTVTDEIAKVVANAPEDFDTLKEISDWIDTHEDSASAMNTQIQANKNEIASLKTEVAGKSDIGHTHSASDITSGILPIARGGTGQTTQADINKAIVGGLEEGESDVTDGTMFVSSYASDNGFADTNALNKPYKRKFSRVWEYIKGKISSVLGLTASNYGGKSAKSSFLDEYVGAGGTRPTSGNIIPKDATEYGGMRKDVVTSSMTDGSHPGQDGHLLTMFWDNSGRYDSQVFVSNEKQPTTVKVRVKANEADYGPWVDLITSQNIGSQTVAKAETADTATKATQDASGNVITDTYLPLSGGAMTGDIQYKGSKATEKMIKFIDNKNDAWGNGIAIGGGGATIIGGGESSDVLKSAITSGGDEVMKIGNDTDVEIWTNLQDGIASGKKFTFGADGNITTPLGTVALKSDINEDLYYEDYRFENPTWQTVGNVYYAPMIKTWTGDIRNKIISAQVVYWTGFYPWAIFDHVNPGSPNTTLELFSANNAQGWCIVRVWYKR